MCGVGRPAHSVGCRSLTAEETFESKPCAGSGDPRTACVRRAAHSVFWNSLFVFWNSLWAARPTMADFKISELDPTIDFDNLPFWDVVIVGAGPGGLAASLTTAHRGLTTLVIEAKSKPGGQPEFLYADKRIVDIPGFPDGITGAELSERTYRQAVNAAVQFRFNEELARSKTRPR